ncbi:MAG: sodium/proton-translocating pyrophosphatase [Ruthenibacterium lactatiformans]
MEITFDLMDPLVFFGMLVGAAIPAVFSAMLIMGVNRNSQLMVKEIHRQFKEIPGLKEGTGKPIARCIDISRWAPSVTGPRGPYSHAPRLLVGLSVACRPSAGT